MELPEKTALHSHAWHLLVKGGGLALRIHAGIRIGEDHFGDLSFQAEDALIELDFDKGRLVLHVLATANEPPPPGVYVDIDTRAEVAFPNNTFEIDPQFATAGKCQDTVHIAIKTPRSVEFNSLDTTDAITIGAVESEQAAVGRTEGQLQPSASSLRGQHGVFGKSTRLIYGSLVLFASFIFGLAYLTTQLGTTPNDPAQPQSSGSPDRVLESSQTEESSSRKFSTPSSVPAGAAGEQTDQSASPDASTERSTAKPAATNATEPIDIDTREKLTKEVTPALPEPEVMIKMTSAPRPETKVVAETTTQTVPDSQVRGPEDQQDIEIIEIDETPPAPNPLVDELMANKAAPELDSNIDDFLLALGLAESETPTSLNYSLTEPPAKTSEEIIAEIMRLPVTQEPPPDTTLLLPPIRAISTLQPINQTPPKYPRQAPKGADGTVDLEITLSTRGRVDSVEILGDPPNYFARPAAEAARKWTFEPAMIDGKPASVRTQIRLTFRG